MNGGRRIVQKYQHVIMGMPTKIPLTKVRAFVMIQNGGRSSYEPSPLKFVIFRKDKRSHEIYGSKRSYFTYIRSIEHIYQ